MRESIIRFCKIRIEEIKKKFKDPFEIPAGEHNAKIIAFREVLSHIDAIRPAKGRLINPTMRSVAIHLFEMISNMNKLDDYEAIISITDYLNEHVVVKKKDDSRIERITESAYHGSRVMIPFADVIIKAEEERIILLPLDMDKIAIIGINRVFREGVNRCVEDMGNCIGYKVEFIPEIVEDPSDNLISTIYVTEDEGRNIMDSLPSK